LKINKFCAKNKSMKTQLLLVGLAVLIIALGAGFLLARAAFSLTPQQCYDDCIQRGFPDNYCTFMCYGTLPGGPQLPGPGAPATPGGPPGPIQPAPGPIQPAPGPGVFEIPNPLKCGDIPCVLDEIASFLFWLATPILTIMVLWAAFLFLTSGGDPNRVRAARNTLIWAAVGFAVVFINKGIALIIKEILGGGSP
jgi:hypothetical protein